MWKDYSKSYIKNNRASSTSIMAAALVAAMFLSLLCSIAYDLWVYEAEKIILEEGDWQGRIVCERFTEEDLSLIHRFPNVKKAVVRDGSPGQDAAVIDLYFQKPRRIYQDLPLILAQLGPERASIGYHALLLSWYLIHDPEDASPPMLLTLYLAILIVAALSLILIIRTSFELSMNARIHQFGIFSSIGATPRQIRICLLQEAAALSLLPMLLGHALGIWISTCLIRAVNLFAAGVAGRHAAAFHYHPLLSVVSIAVSALTVLISAWIPARRLSRMTPLGAIRETAGIQLKKRRHSRILSALFGIKGELAGNALKAQRKHLRISTWSLSLSFLSFSVMLCFTTLSAISTRYTYFERYQDAWDIMITLKDTALTDLDLKRNSPDLPGVRDAVIYQKAGSVTFLKESSQSDELSSLGGLDTVAKIQETDRGFPVSVPLIILDDASFLDFCSQIQVTPSLDGAVVLNRIWDRTNSDFRTPAYIPFVKEDAQPTIICRDDQRAQIPVLAYTQTVPLLREEYDDPALVHFIPLTLWNRTPRELCQIEPDSSIRILSEGNADLTDLDRLEKEILQRIPRIYRTESENRVREKLSNDDLIHGMKVIMGAFCVLLALIGIANVFANALGSLRQRKREYAQYMSIGLTPQELRRIFFIEASVTAGRPLLITFPLTALFIQFTVTISHLDPRVFWAEAPILPILLFAAGIVSSVALAYHIGVRRLLKCDLNETLRDDTMI